MAHTSNEPAISDMARVLQTAMVFMKAACERIGQCHAAAINADASCQGIFLNVICSIFLYRDLHLRLASEILREIKHESESFLNNDDATIKANIGEFAKNIRKYPELLKQLTDFNVHLLEDLKLQKIAAQNLRATYHLEQRTRHEAELLQATKVAEGMKALYESKKGKWTNVMSGVVGFSCSSALLSGGLLLPLAGAVFFGGGALALGRTHDYKQVSLDAERDRASKDMAYQQALAQEQAAEAAILAIQEMLPVLENSTEGIDRVAGFFRVLQNDVTSNKEAAANLADTLSQGNSRRSILYLLRLKNSLKSNIAACDQFINYYGTTLDQISTIEKYIAPGSFNSRQYIEHWRRHKQLPALQD